MGVACMAVSSQETLDEELFERKKETWAEYMPNIIEELGKGSQNEIKWL